MIIKIPPVDLQAEFREIQPELIKRTRCVYQSGQYILGKEVEQFENHFARFIDTRYAVGVASGSDALLISLMAFGIKEGDEVLTTPFSFIATATAIARLGAKPVFVDVDPDTLNLDPSLIEKKLTRRTRGIIPVHLYGNPCRMDQIMAIAKRRDLFVIEDCAQACGATFKGSRVGSFGELGTFSFYPTKTLGAMGDAGVITTNDKKLYQKIKSLHRHGEEGQDHSYRHTSIGINSRLDEIQAAVLDVKLRHLAKWNEARRRAAERYNQLILKTVIANPEKNVSFPHALGGNPESRSPTLSEKNVKFFPKSAPRMGASVKAFGDDKRTRPRNDDHIILPTETPRGKSVYHQYVIRTHRRDQLVRHLRKLGIYTAVFYPLPFHLQPCFRYLGYKKGDFPNAEMAASEVLSLPLFPQIRKEQQKLVISALRNFASQ